MQQVIVKTYVGNETEAMESFRRDASLMSQNDYYPTSQSYAAGSYGCGSFIGALLLCFLIVGIFIFIYMIIVKPAGTLSVTYEYRAKTEPPTQVVDSEKVCPVCAEHVKFAAKKCRFCGHEFLNPI